MIKKFSMLMILAVALLIGGFNQRTEAAEVFVGHYSDGSPVYLITEMVVIRSYHPYSFNCRVRVNYDYLDYSFFPYNGSPYYQNSEGYEGYVNSGSPVASNIYHYVVNNWRAR